MNIAIFASYNASVLEEILQNGFNVKLIITNNSNANVLNKAKKYGIKSVLINKKLYQNETKKILEVLKEHKIDLIVLAGYMKKIDKEIVKKYKNKIINSHPSLLPKYGGEGMYGINVHKEVIRNKEKISGATIHYVDIEYDSGEIILQEKLNVNPNWDEFELEAHIKELEKKAIVKALKSLS